VTPRIVSSAEWTAASRQLRAAEEQALDTIQQLASRRRELPAVKIEKDYVFEGPSGPLRLLDLFEGREQLIVQHFMFDPDWDAGCPVCSLQADSVGHLAHLHARGTTYAAVSRAPFSKIESFHRRMGWTFPYYSSHGSDFNYDFHVTHDESVAPVEYGFRTAQELIDRGEDYFAGPGEKGAVSVFLRDGDTVLHTWSGYGPVVDLLSGTDMLLDLTPLGRQQEQVELFLHDEYPGSAPEREPGDEALIDYLRAQRDVVLAIVQGLDEEAWHRSIVPSGWTPAGLVEHLIGAEWHWFQVVVSGFEPEPLPGEEVTPYDPTAAFVSDLPSAELIAAYREQCAQSEAVLAATPLSALPRGKHAFPGDPESAEPANVREAVLHMIEETARHAGHLDIVRELIDGRTGLGPR
jgi:predicted dithiol-disulfide oxidoreductase (DUF899 family)/uncharacterized damage-inducible protein DinB